MAGAAVLGRLTWLIAEVVDLIEETPRVKTLALACPGWPGHLPGQHVDIRLTAEDGYQAQRSYSIATPEDGQRLALTVERVEDGEVSPFLVDEVLLGDRFEIRGPIGGYFVWDPSDRGPLQLIAGGSGIVPLMAMIRAWAGSGRVAPIRLLYSARGLEDLIFHDEIRDETGSGLDVSFTLTRSRPEGWVGFGRRVDGKIIEEVAWPADDGPLVFVCGPTGFVESVSASLVELGHQPELVKTERFGPSGGGS